MGCANLSKYSAVFNRLVDNFTIFCGIVADTVVFFGNIYEIGCGFSVVATDLAGMVVQRLESNKNG